VGRFGINWTNGETFYNFSYLQLPPGGAMAPPYGSWILYFSLPLGAILFLSLRKRLTFQIGSSHQIINPE
jgi:hypothetical protein